MPRFALSNCCCLGETVIGYPCLQNPAAQAEPLFDFQWNDPPFEISTLPAGAAIVGNELQIGPVDNSTNDVTPTFVDPLSPPSVLSIVPTQRQMIELFFEYDIQEPTGLADTDVINLGIVSDLGLPAYGGNLGADAYRVDIAISQQPWEYWIRIGGSEITLIDPVTPIVIRWLRRTIQDPTGAVRFQLECFVNGTSLYRSGVSNIWYDCHTPPCPFVLPYTRFETDYFTPISGLPIHRITHPRFGITQTNAPCLSTTFTISYPDYTSADRTNDPLYNWTLNNSHTGEFIDVERTGGVEPITYAKTSGDSPGSFALNASTGQWLENDGLGNDLAGSGTMEITATDDDGNTATTNVSWIISFNLGLGGIGSTFQVGFGLIELGTAEINSTFKIG